MAKILITGNGFDLFHHLPTKYHHFISIMQTIENNVYATDVSFEKLFGEVFKLRYQSDYNSIVENYNSGNIKFSSEKLNKIRQLLETNLWYKHFKNVLEIDTWIDFEMEIESILNQFEIFNKHEDKRVVRKNLFDDYLFGFTNFELFEIIKNKPISQIPFRLNEKYINGRKFSIDIKKMLDDLAKSFEGFIVIFNRYLVDVVSVFYSEIKQKSEIPFHLLSEIYTFNYTPTLENLYKVEKSKVVYLHGEINEDCSKQNLVLGISELPKHIRMSKMFDFTKYYQKINKKSNKKFIDIPEQKSHSLDENIFYIIGHSLDDSDKEYISDLFKFLDFDLRKNAKICVFYFNSRDMENKLRNLFSIIGRDIVVNMDKEDRLYFVELNEKNIIKEFERQTYKYEIFI
ncbi:AbiH family protein [Flavobacterium aquariorum]|nr:AbiH family protein [Flavobacterium aquariorum]